LGIYIHKMKIRSALSLKDTGKILHNRFVLYFVLFLALADLLYLAMGREFMSVAVFILSGFVTSFFSKNMMVIMCVAMVITNILKYGTDIRMQEGLKEGPTDEAKPETKDDADAKPDTKPVEMKPEPKPVEMKPEPKPVESKPQSKPVEPKPEPKPVESKPQSKPVEPKSDDAKIVLTEEEKRKFTENMEKLEAYEPLFTSMDKLMGKISNLISP
jgi:outer membrane biosynthesis protein TonB